MIQILFQISQRQPVTPLHRTHARTRDQRRDVAITFTVGGEQHQPGAAVDLHLRADDKFEAVFFSRLVRAHHTGERTLIGDRQRAITLRPRARHQLVGMRGTAQEGKVANTVQLGVAGECRQGYKNNNKNKYL